MQELKKDLDFEYEDEEDYEDEEPSLLERFSYPEKLEIDEILSIWRKIKPDDSLEKQNEQIADFSFDPHIGVFGASLVVANHLFENILAMLSKAGLSKLELSKLEDLSLEYKKASILPIEVDEDDEDYDKYLASLEGPDPFNIEEKRLAALEDLLSKHEGLRFEKEELFILYADIVWTMSSF